MILLQLFGCGSGGIQTLPDPGANKMTAENSWLVDAMPLVSMLERGSYTGIAFQADAIAHFEAEASQVDAAIRGIQLRNRPDPPGTIAFTEYLLTHTSTSPQPVYALTSGYLHYLHQGQSDPNLLGGAETQADEEIVILKPLPSILEEWKMSHPGSTALLEECASLNVELVSDASLRQLIKTSKTEDYFRQVYKLKKGSDFQGTTGWDEEYLNLFKEFPDVSILVRGGVQIASTKANSSTDPSQRITMLFSVDGTWTGHDDKVKAFFQYHQRRDRLGGHPLIAKLIGHSVQSGTVDVIAPFAENGARTKYRLLQDFKSLSTSSDPEYHPLALDPDQDPHRLIVPKPPGNGILPIPNLPLRPDHWLTRLKISNPLGLQITIGFQPAEVNVTPASFSAPEQVVEISATAGSPPETDIEITTPDGTVAQKLRLVFLGFQTAAVKFYKLRDTNANHTTSMTESKLRDVLAYANEILGRQTSVYISPIEENSSILHDLLYAGDLGDPITTGGPGISGAEDLYDQVAGTSQTENLKVVFVWDEEISSSSIGINYRPGGWGYPNYVLIMIDTQASTGYNADVKDVAQTLVHEVGHWFAQVFITWGQGTPECGGLDKHFSHGKCLGGNWSLLGNLMTSKGSENVLITIEQATVYNDYAAQILP